MLSYNRLALAAAPERISAKTPTVVQRDSVAHCRVATPAGEAQDGQGWVWNHRAGAMTWADPADGGLPQRRHDVDVFATPDTQTTWSTIAADSSVHGAFRGCATQNSEIGWDLPLPAGTWEITLIHQRGPDRGDYTVTVDGTAAGTISGYAAAVERNIISRISGVVIATLGTKRLLLKIARKHPNSSGYHAEISVVSMRKIE